MKTVFGFEWRIAEYPELIIAFFVFCLVVGFYILLRYNNSLQLKKIQSDQLFLFKTKQMGLTGFQQKVLNGIINTLRLGDPVRILDNPGLFESAIANFLLYLQNRQEKPDTLPSICKDIIITYEKLYHPTMFKNPLDSIDNMENDLLLYIETANGSIFIGKIQNIDGNRISLKLFRNPKTIVNAEPGTPVNVFLWRAGDAEYGFQSALLSIGTATIEIETPKEFVRGKEVRHPYVDVIIPCTISEYSKSVPEETRNPKKEPPEMNAIIYKLHDDELVVRMSRKLDYNKTYNLNFVLADFKVRVVAIIISDRTLQEENVFYFTFRYTEITEAAKSIIKKYVSEHL